MTAADGREIELKFQLTPASCGILEASAMFAAAEVARLEQVTTYFDTRDETLRAAGYSLRIRKCAGGFVQTVKSRASQGSMASDREEWEWQVADRIPDIRVLDEVPALVELAERLDGKLEPAFRTVIRRARRTFFPGQGSIVEVVIDVGWIRARRAWAPVGELEIELKRGPASPMYALAIQLQSLAPMRISVESKSLRGWALRNGVEQTPQVAVMPSLAPGMGIAAAFRTQIGAKMAHLIANIEPTLRRDPEGLHQMRIALHGARAILRLFLPGFRHLHLARFDAELKRICHRLGIARDWDVFCLETLPLATLELPSQNLSKLASRADLQRSAAHSEVEADIQGQHFTALLLALSEATESFAARHGVPSHDPPDHQLQSDLPCLLDRIAKRSKVRGQNAQSLSRHDLHRFRKSLDLLCHNANAFAELFLGRNSQSYIGACTALQEVLGLANDMVTSNRLALSLAGILEPDLAQAAKAIGRWSKSRRKAALSGLKRSNRSFRASEPFWV